MNEDTVMLKTPSLPYYLGAGRSYFDIGDHHPNRRNLGIYDLLILVKGELYIGENDQQWILREGDTLLLLPEGEHFSVRPCVEHTEFYWVHFEHVDKQENSPHYSSYNEGVLYSSRPFSNPYTMRLPKHSNLANPQAAFNLLEQLLDLQSEHSFWQEQRLFGELLSMLEMRGLHGVDSGALRLAEQAAIYLQKNYKSRITNESLSAALHFHPNYITRCMKTKYGQTPMDYLNQFRLERAKRLLVTTDWQMDRIAEEIGYSYAPYFSSCFKRYTSLSPLQFRKQYMK